MLCLVASRTVDASLSSSQARLKMRLFFRIKTVTIRRTLQFPHMHDQEKEAQKCAEGEELYLKTQALTDAQRGKLAVRECTAARKLSIPG